MVRVKIEKLVYGGYGFGRAAGKGVFVPYSAPGDELDVVITKHRKNFGYAKIEKVIAASNLRCEPECRHYTICGGCHLQHINYAAQLLWKQIILEEQLARLAGIKDPSVLPTVPSPKIWKYRNRIQMHADGGRIGYHKMETRSIVDVEFCQLAEDAVNEKLKEVRLGGRRRARPRMDIACSEINTFAQVNPSANGKLKELVREWVGEKPFKTVLELYAGSGNLTFGLAPLANKIIAVELDKEAAAEGEKEARRRNLRNVQFVAQKAERFLRNFRPADGGIDLILADPPREGLGGDVISHILKLSPPRILYVSCNPSTLARDIKALAAGGYRFVKAQPVDMFPQTYHIESVADVRLTG